MFGFGRQKDLQTTRPVATSRLPEFVRQTPGVVLVSKEDIYTADSEQPVLLARKGAEVDPDALPKFIRNGAKPSQFQVKHEPDAAAPFQTNPLMMGEVFKTSSRSQKNILILDPEQKSLKRLIDCLFTCGFSLNRIHPVRIPANLDWTIRKYHPQVLIVDYDLNNGMTGLGLLQDLAGKDAFEKIILTLSHPENLSAHEQKWINRVCAENEIEILLKPVNRYTLSTLLEAI